jgi:hypothetical protein
MTNGGHIANRNILGNDGATRMGEGTRQESHIGFPSGQSLNDDELAHLTKNIKG